MFRYAIVTLDGTIMLVDNCDKPPMESIMWNLQVININNEYQDL